MESKSTQRLELLEKHMLPNQTFNSGRVLPKSDDDIVIVALARTAMTRAKRGPQKDTPTEGMLTPVLKAVIAQAGIDPKLIDDVCIGNCLAPGAAAHTSRMAMFMAGIPETASLSGVNRQCSSGLQAVMNIANSVRSRQIDIGIGGGAESMSLYAMDGVVDPNILD
jgi:acetyl-CoA acyltransferase 1